MSDEVWWAEGVREGVYISSTHPDVMTQRGFSATVDRHEWEQMGGGDLLFGEIIPIHPLRIERVEVEK